jgi:predicted ArsR family transcriptional regulator
MTSLSHPLRRSLYAYVADATGDVGRDEAAAALHVSRELCAFHLDKLVHAGLLEATYRRTGARRGPGAGRPAKFYRRAKQTISVSLPPRRYDLAAGVLIRALRRTDKGKAEETVREAARDLGRELAGEHRAPSGSEQNDGWQQALTSLEACGFEPRPHEGGEIAMRNCPFDSLVRTDRSLACGMNLGLMEGLLDGFQITTFQAALDPAPGRCCVTLQPAGVRSESAHNDSNTLISACTSNGKDHHS